MNAKRALKGERVRALAFAVQSVVLLGLFVYFGSYRFDPATFDPKQGGPLVIVDRHGEVLRRVPSQDGRPGRSTWVRLSEIDSHAVQTLLASEDQAFFRHGGVDFFALLRGLTLTLTTPGRYGGSTLTMQLAKLVHSQGKARSASVKLQEMRAAWGIERHLSKQQIVEQYLNRAYYGRGAYGIEAAAQRYFGKAAHSLSTGEATFLAVLPRGPSFYDPMRHRTRTLRRRAHLFGLLQAQGRMTAGEVQRAAAEPLDIQLHPFPFRAPHATTWILSTLPASVRSRGGVVHSTIDLALQEALETRVREHVLGRRKVDVRQAGAVLIEAETGAVRAMVGSMDYDGSEGGHLNIVTRRRYPGSALKPFVYGTAIEHGESPASIAYDVRGISEHYFETGAREHGPVPYREALAGSYNFAAVNVLEEVGVAPVVGTLQRAGVGPVSQLPGVYGSRLALGSTKVRLLDLTAGYRAFVRGGQVLPAYGVEQVAASSFRSTAAEPSEALSAQAAWLVMDMLSDPEARRPMFGDELAVDLPYRVVAKTGTAEGFADTVAVLATNDWLVGAWAGRFDGKATQGQAGMAAAAPLARAALLLATDGRAQILPARPSGLRQHAVCPLSGKAPGPHCTHERREWFIEGTAPQETCSWHQSDGHVDFPPEARRTQ